MVPQTGIDAGSGQQVVYVEKRAPRGFWGVLWKWALIIWTVFSAYDAMRISVVAHDLVTKSGGLGGLAVSNIAANKMLEVFVVWLFGAAVLGGLTYATRGAKIIEAVPVSVRGSGAKS